MMNRRQTLVALLALGMLAGPSALAEEAAAIAAVVHPPTDETQISNLDLQTLLAVGNSLRAPVLWAQRDGRRYEIRDPAIRDRAAEAARPVTMINEKYQAFQWRARPV